MNKIINWMGGWPNEGLISVSDWEQKLAAAAERERRQGAEDEPAESPNGKDDLKDALATGLLREKTEGKAERIRLFPGADAALARLAAKGLSPGDVVLTERLTSRSALQAFRKAGVRAEAVAGDGGGPDPEALKQAIARHKPKLLYAAPVVSDPEGSVWPDRRIAEIEKVCRETGTAWIRDDRQEHLLYRESETSHRVAGHFGKDLSVGVISVGQLPPGLVAGLRFGWAAGDPAELERWFPAEPREGGRKEPGLTTLERRALGDLLRDQPLEPLLDLLRVQCGERARRLTELLEKQGRIPGLGWRMPKGGLHLWLRLPAGLDGDALLRGAWIKGLMFQPGAPFYAADPEPHTLRLTFAFADDKQMKLGVARLADAIGEFLGRFDIR